MTKKKTLTLALNDELKEFILPQTDMEIVRLIRKEAKQLSYVNACYVYSLVRDGLLDRMVFGDHDYFRDFEVLDHQAGLKSGAHVRRFARCLRGLGLEKNPVLFLEGMEEKVLNFMLKRSEEQ